MALYRRGRIWWVDFYEHGKRVQESTRTTNKREAELHHAMRLSEVARGVYAKPVKVSLEDFGRQYLEHAKLHKRCWKRDEQMLGHLHRFFGQATLVEINPLRIEGYQSTRVQKVCPATVNREMALLKHMFNMAERWDLFHGPNPVRRVKFLREDNLQFQTLSEQEEKALLACCPPYLQDMVIFAINTGLRSGDIFRLRWEDVDLERKRLNLMVKKTQRPLELPLNDVAYGVTEGRSGIRKGPFVFYNPITGDRFWDVKLGLKNACKRVGLDGVTWHTFRHTFASRLTRSGADIVTVKELLGHSTVTVTMRYAHTNYETKERAVQLMSRSDKTVTMVPKRSKTG